MSPRATVTSAVPLAPAKWRTPWETLHEAASALTEAARIGFVLVTDNRPYAGFFIGDTKKPWQGKGAPLQVVILWAGRPLDPGTIQGWRNALVEEADVSYQFLQPPQELWNPGQWTDWLTSVLGEWALPRATPEDQGLRVGDLVKYQSLPGAEATGYDPSLLMVPLSGPMANVLAELDECKRRYRDAINSVKKGDVGKRRQAVLQVLERLHAYSPMRQGINGSGEDSVKDILDRVNRVMHEQGLLIDRRRLPRVLLLGPSGSGKSHIARYLAWRTSVDKPDGSYSRPFKRVPVPDYLNKEDMFEYDVFGFTAGAFTGARERGSRGFLAERMAGVVFFDEIGDASPQIQAKLLAYLDDYHVAPRGWEGEPFFCPMLVVAATNRPIREWARLGGDGDASGGRFRNDLLRRFDVVVTIPSLNDRKGDLPYIIDAMLQSAAINPGNKITEVGRQAFGALQEFDFDSGNYRVLEAILRRACGIARRSDRHYLVHTDVASSKDYT